MPREINCLAQTVTAIATLATCLELQALFVAERLATGLIDLKGFGENIKEEIHGCIPIVDGCAYSNSKLGS